MRNIEAEQSSDALRGVLETAGAPVYVKTPSSAVVAAVLDVVAELGDPPTVRILVSDQSLAAGVEQSRLSRTEDDLAVPRGVAVRSSHALVTDTAIVTRDGVAQFTTDLEATVELPAAASEAFVRSVYEAHAREWEQAAPISPEDVAR